MVAWVVNYRPHHCQARKSHPIRALPLSDVSTFRRLDDPRFWSYLHTGTLPRLIPFLCHSYENCRVCTQNSHSGTSSPRAKPRTACHLPRYSNSFFSSSCALFCTFLQSQKEQPPCFQSFPHSASKNTPPGVTSVKPNAFLSFRPVFSFSSLPFPYYPSYPLPM